LERTLIITEKIVLEYHGEEMKEKTIQLLRDKNFQLVLENNKDRVLYLKKIINDK